MQGKSSRPLGGKGRAFDVKFTPGSFYPFVEWSVYRLTYMSMYLREILDVKGQALEARILALEDEGKIVRIAEAFLCERLPELDEPVELMRRIVECMVENRDITEVEDVAGRST
jgi:hypothetical protein